LQILTSAQNTYATEEQIMSPDTYDAAKSDRIQGLEKLLTEAQDQVAGLNAELADCTKTKVEEDQSGEAKQKVDEFVHLQLQRIDALEQEVASSTNQLELASRAEEALQSQLEHLQERLGAGAYNPATTSVLSLSSNPASQDLAVRTGMLQCLRAENEALLAGARLTDDDRVPASSLERYKLELDEMHEQVRNTQKLGERRLEAFRQKAADLRGSVSALLGYNLDFKAEDQIRLTSIFAPSKAHALLFSIEAGAGSSARECKLIGDGEKGLSDAERRAYQFWVSERKCWPGFTASVLLEQYEAVTRGGKHLGIVSA
jgi:mitotic spindle assembly checkpoint protein MAD1